MFSLEKQNAKLTSVNPRAEIHGTDKVMAADLKFEIKVSNDVLSEFDPSLKFSLYKKQDGSGQTELLNEPGHLPALKFPLMGPVKWGKDFSGYEVVVHYGISGKEDIHLATCQVDQFRFDCQDGGTVVVAFRVIAHPEAKALGRLCEMIQTDVELSLIEPTEEQQADDLLKAA
jgi:hypothetical protein